MLITITLFLLLPTTLLCDQQFLQFQLQYGILYPTEQQSSYRRQIFEKNLALITQSNVEHPQYTLGVTQWADRTEEQAKSILMVRRPNTTAQGKMKTGNSLRKVGYPREVDWRNSCVVTRAKNQGSCGACWAFSTVANAESYLNLMRETNYDLSEEYVLECTQSSDCSGGYPQAAMDLLLRTGCPTESFYPYKASNYGTKGKPSTPAICSSTSRIALPPNTQKQAMGQLTPQQLYSLLESSPVVTYFYSMSNFIYYKSGVFSCPSTTDEQLNHGVEVVGYDANGNFIIKNSWGTKWGLNGFAYINARNNCGITMYAYRFVGGVGNRTNGKVCSNNNGLALKVSALLTFLLLLLI